MRLKCCGVKELKVVTIENCRKLPQTNPCLNAVGCEKQEAEFGEKNIKWVPRNLGVSSCWAPE